MSKSFSLGTVEEGGSAEATIKDGNEIAPCPASSSAFEGFSCTSSAGGIGASVSRGVGSRTFFSSATLLEVPQERKCRNRSKNGRRREGEGDAEVREGGEGVELERRIGVPGGGFWSGRVSPFVFTNANGVVVSGGGSVRAKAFGKGDAGKGSFEPSMGSGWFAGDVGEGVRFGSGAGNNVDATTERFASGGFFASATAAASWGGVSPFPTAPVSSPSFAVKEARKDSLFCRPSVLAAGSTAVLAIPSAAPKVSTELERIG